MSIDTIQKMRLTWILAVFFCTGFALATPRPYRFHKVHDSGIPRSVQSSRDTMRVLVIRVDFPRDTLATTTGDGGFDFGNREGRIIDPPPHDSVYFQRQFQFVNNYFHQVSKGKVTLLADVYPIGNRNAYRMPEPMWHYHPSSTDNEGTNDSITHLWKTAWDSAANDYSIAFYNGDHVNPISNYDLFVVVHAGGGNEYDLGFNYTPFNIPSGYITRSDYAKYLNISDSRGLPLRDSTVWIPEGALLPELSSQKIGDEWVDIGNGGLYCLLIGRALGLPFLYDVDDGTSRVGRWSLMDRGFGTFFGILPGYPDAYTRVRMGWTQPVSAPPAGDVQLRIPQADTIALPEVMRFEGAGDEYYLMEARNRDVDSLDYAYVYDAAGHRAKLTNTYGIELDPSVPLDSFGVIVRADNFEFDTPGSGVLIWRVNAVEELRRESLGLPLNTGNPPYVLKLIEGDGSEDIGQNYGMFSPGSGTETGSPFDAYFRNNTEWSNANNGDAVVRFDRNVNPPSILSNGAPASFSLSHFSQPGRVMTFSVFRAPQISGEVHLRIPASPTPMVAIPFDANRDGQDEFWIADSNLLYAYSANGVSMGTLPVSYVRRDSVTGSTVDSIMTYVVARFSAPPVLRMCAGQSSGSSYLLLYSGFSAGASNQLESYLVVPIDTTFTLSLLGSVTLNSRVNAMAYDSLNRKWIIGFDTDSLWRVNINLTGSSPPNATIGFHTTSFDTAGNPIEFAKPTDLTGQPHLTGLSVVTPYAAVNNRLYSHSTSGWNQLGIDTHSDTIQSLAWTTENLFVLTKSQWWLWGGTTLRTDFPRRVTSVSTPTMAVAGLTAANDPIIWYGTETGEIWNLMRTGSDTHYPIAVGIQPVDGLALLSSHLTGTDSIHLGAVSRDGGVYLTTLPLTGITGTTWACATGTASGIPRYTPEKEWSNSVNQGLAFAFVWPNPIRNGQAFIRIGANPAGMNGAKAEVYDMRGDRIATLKNPYPVEGGGYEWKWDASGCSRGLYVIRVNVQGSAVKLIKAAVIR